MKKHTRKRVIALFLALLMLAGFLAGCAPANTASDNTANSPENALNADTTYYKVSFALPKDVSEEERAAITLPEPVMLESGTLLYAVPEATSKDESFAGWYYDAELKKPAPGSDAVEKNLTLYPAFGPIQNFEDDFRINYMSALDVEPDFPIEIVAYGLTEEQIREKLKVTNLSKVNGAEEYVFERLAPDMKALIPDEKTRSLAEEAAKKAQAGKLEGTLTEALSALTAEDPDGGDPLPALSEAVVAELASYYAPQETLQSSAVQAANFIERVKDAGLDPKNVTVSQIAGIMTETELKEYGLTAVAEGTGDEIVLDLEDRFSELLEGLPAAHYVVRPAGRAWNRGDMHQVEILDTASIRFTRNGEIASKYIIYYNITVHQDDFNNMKLSSGLLFLPASQVVGVSLDNGLFKAEAENDGSEMTITKNDESGILTYTGNEAIEAGVTVAVYDGTLKDDGTVDGSVGYFKITQVLGEGKYAFETPEFEEVVFIPDIIPARDDGSFDDGEILLTADQLSFTGQVYESLGLGADTVVEPGDFIAVYTGSINRPDAMVLTGYGCITQATAEGSSIRVRYDKVSEDTLRQASDMFMHMDNVPVPLSDAELEEVGRLIEKDVEDSGFLEDSAEYIKDLITKPEEAILPDSKYADALTEIKFQREEGGEISLEEVRELAGGSRVEVEWPPKLSFLLGLSLQHFDGTGLRGEMAAEMNITIKLNDNADIKIKIVAMIEVEVALGLNIKWEVEWRKAWIFPYIYDIGGTVGLHAGIYIGAGIVVTVQTANVDKTDENASVDSLMSGYAKDAKGNYKFTSDKQNSALKFINKVGGGLEKIAKLNKAGGDGLHLSSIPGIKKSAMDDQGNQTKPDGETDEMHNTVGGSFEEKYSNFIQGSDAEYVPLVNRNLATFELPADPLHIIALSLGINFVVKLKINVMLGVSITYGNAKQITATFTIFHPASESKCGDLETPNFQVDFFIFGMVGVRVGFEFDFRIGVISTALASLGVTAEIGIYLEFYGFFYIAYKWESGKGSHTEMFGSMLVQLGLYLDIDFKMQMGGGKLEQRFDIYDVRWPLLSLGDEYCALDFVIEDDDKRLDLTIEAQTDKNKNQKSTDTHVYGGASIKVPDELFEINFLELDTGEIDSDNMDRKVAVGGGKSFTAWGVNYTQKDERNFHVEFTPKGKNYSNATKADQAKGGFWYDPVTNTIHAKPNSVKDTELWGEFTFTWYQGEPAKTKSALNLGAGFGLNTRKIERTVRVHWTGTPVKGTADLYTVNSADAGLAPLLAGTLPKASVNDMETFKKTYYTHRDTIEYDGLDGVMYYFEMPGISGRYPGYSLQWAKEPSYDKTVMDAYVAAGGNALTHFFRDVFFEAGDGLLLISPSDSRLYTMVRQDTKTKSGMAHVDLFYDITQTECDWHILNDRANHNAPLSSVYETKMRPGYSALDNMPAAIRRIVNRDSAGYQFDWYMYSSTPESTSNQRETRSRKVVFNPYMIVDGEYTKEWKLCTEDGRTTYVDMPAFSEFIGDRSKWVRVTAETVVPTADTVFFAVRSPKTFTVTWKYDGGDRTTQVKFGQNITPPAAASRKGFTFQYWEDEGGQRYTTMPAKDITLYPVFTGNNRTVTWVLDGQRKTSTVKAGTNPLDTSPFKAQNGQSINWTTVKGDILTTVTEEYTLPDSDTTLYGMYVYQTDWLMFDTGNGAYTELTSGQYNYQENMAGAKVLENLPEEVSKYLSDKRYTYSYYRVYALGKDAVKAQKNSWGAVYNSTLFYARNSTYILQRSPVMTIVTWKYDDGDVPTRNWVGRKLAAPKDAVRKGYTLTGWADAEGNSYDYPPYKDVVLYPQFKEHDHSWDSGTVTASATCSAAGVRTFTCTECGKTMTQAIAIAASSHTGNTEIRGAKAATCSAEGYTGDTYCKDCGVKLASGTAIAKLAHTPAAAVRENEVDATCSAEGSYDEVVYCSVCDEEISRTHKATEKLAHTPAAAVQENVVDATCTAAGSYDEVVYCSVCNEELSRTAKTVAALGHDMTAHAAAAASCTAAGNSAYWSCSRCNKYFSDAEGNNEIAADSWILPATGHSPAAAVKENEVPASCTADGGYDEVVYCMVCNEELSRTHKTTEKLAHTPAAAVQENVVAATCTSAGSYDEVVYCSVCDEEISRTHKTTEKLAHTPASAVQENVVAASCTSAGSYDEVVYCSVCDEEISRTAKTVAALGHNMTAHAAAAASCTAAGNSAYWSCSRCKKYFSDAEGNNEIAAESWVIPAAGHSWNTGEITTEPGCTTAGVKTYTCTVCSETKTESIDALGHNMTAHAAAAASCTAAGNSAYWSCSRCNKYFSDAEGNNEIAADSWIIPATGHSPAAAVTENATAAVCTEGGSYDQVVYCSVCHEELSRTHKTVAASGHSPAAAVKENEVAASCTADGGYDEVVYCTVCHEELSRTHKTVAALGHDMTAHAAAAASCTAAGNSAYWHCSRCNKYFSDSEGTAVIAADSWILPATGHSPAAAVKENEAAASCTADGGYDEVVYCTVCNDEISRTHTTVPATGHSPAAAVKENEVPASCTADGGYDEVVYCTVCNAEISRTHTTVPATGHSWNSGEITTEPGCTTAGVKTFTCTVCSETKTESIDALGHNMTAHAAAAASCTAAGNSAYWSCSRCSKYFSDAEGNNEIAADSWILPALGHSWNTPTWTRTGTTAAAAHFTCARDASHTETVTATITPEISEADGIVTYTATAFLDGTSYTDSSVTRILSRLGNDDTGLPVLVLEFITNTAADPEVNAEKLSELPLDRLYLGTYTGADFNTREELEAELTWAEEYSTVKITDILPGDKFKVHVKPADLSTYAEIDVELTVITLAEFEELLGG